jgi:hypothetical protein
MSEKKSTTGIAEVHDSLRDNALRVVDEIAKVQPQVILSVSRLQLDTIEASKNIVKIAFDTQKQIASGLNVFVPSQVPEQIVGPSNGIINNFVTATEINNQLVLNALDVARENTRIYGEAVAACTEYNSNILNAWTSFWLTLQQQYFVRA